MTALELIYDKLRKGECFGRIDSHRLGGTYFWEVLSCDGTYIHWRHFGSSSNKMSLTSLRWILTTIFETTPEQFLFDYTTFHEWQRVDNCYKN